MELEQACRCLPVRTSTGRHHCNRSFCRTPPRLRRHASRPQRVANDSRATTEQTPHAAATTDPATSALERHFRSIKHDLSCAAHRLDTSFDETSHDGNPHPLKLMRRINHLETVVGKLQRDWAQLEEDRERIVPAVRRYPPSLACHPPFAPYTASRSHEIKATTTTTTTTAAAAAPRQAAR